MMRVNDIGPTDSSLDTILGIGLQVDRECQTKASGIDVADKAATDLVLQLGAAGFVADRQMAEILSELSESRRVERTICNSRSARTGQATS